MQKSLKSSDINFYKSKTLYKYFAPTIDKKPVIEKVKYWPISPSLYIPFFKRGKSIKEAIEPQIITHVEI